MAPRPPPLTAAELQELNRTVKSATSRRLLWEIHRLRAILLRANELQIMIHNDRFLGRDTQILKRLTVLRSDLEREPVIAEEQERDDLRVSVAKSPSLTFEIF